MPVPCTSYQAFNCDTKGLILVDIYTKAFPFNKFTKRSTRKTYHFSEYKMLKYNFTHRLFLLGSGAV
jgi:hypothetical protein